MREVEVEDEGNDSLDEGNDNSEDVAEDGADELEDKGDERADEAADNNEEVEERLVDGSTSDLEDRAESLEDNLWMDPMSNQTKPNQCKAEETYNDDTRNKLAELLDGDDSSTLNRSKDDLNGLANETLEASDSTSQDILDLADGAAARIESSVLRGDKLCTTVVSTGSC